VERNLPDDDDDDDDERGAKSKANGVSDLQQASTYQFSIVTVVYFTAVHSTQNREMHSK
jgi:hypothetical protein